MLNTTPEPAGNDLVPLVEKSFVADRPSLAKSSKWVLVGTLLSRPVQLFTAVLIARWLGPAEYGVFGLATSLAVTVSLVAALGLGDAANKYVAEYYRNDKAKATQFAAVIIWSATSFGTLLFVGLWFSKNLWLSWVFPPSTTTTVVGLCLCLAWTNLIFALLSGILSGLQRFREFSMMSLLQAVAVAVFVLALGRYGSEGALVAYVAGSAICLVWAAAMLARADGGIFFWPGLAGLTQLRPILKFAVPIWVGAFAFTPAVTFALAFLARQPNGEHELGVFNTANGLRVLVAVLPGVISLVIAPALMEEGGTHGDENSYGQLLEKGFTALILLTFPLFILSLFLSDLLFLMYGKAYGAAFYFFMPLTASAAIAAIGQPVTTVMAAKNRTWVSLGFGIIKSLLVIVLALFFVPTYLGWGLTWVFFASEISYFFLAVEFCRRTDAVSPFFRRAFYWSSLGVAALLAVSLYLPAVARWIVALPLALLVTLLLLRVTRETGNWIAHLAPVRFRPGTERLLRLITS